MVEYNYLLTFEVDIMDNFTRAVRFLKPDYIPMTFSINNACWHHYPKEALWDLMEAHKLLFPDFVRPAPDWMPELPLVARKDHPYTDPMGCTWVTADDGITGSVKHHPLEDWSAFGTTWHIPDPDKTDGLYMVDWAQRKADWAALQSSGGSFQGKLRHGHTFLQLCDLRGYENVLMDMMDEEPLLLELLEQLTDFNLAVVRHFIEGGCSAMKYPEDLGMQLGPMLPPDLFRQFVKPCYEKIMQPAREADIPIHMHSDGDIRLLADDLIHSGVEILNLQDRVNGIDWIAEKFRGKLCVEVDIDRQAVTPFGTPAEIDRMIRDTVSKISTPDGGLCLIYGLYPGVPLKNVEALMDAMEKYAFYHS